MITQLFYKVVDKNSAEYKANPNKSKADRENQLSKTTKKTGNEESLATYTVTGMEGQDFTSSGVRHFKDYRLYQPAQSNGTSEHSAVALRLGISSWMRMHTALSGLRKLLKKTAQSLSAFIFLDPKQQSKRSNGTLDTDGYMLIAETEPVAPGQITPNRL